MTSQPLPLRRVSPISRFLRLAALSALVAGAATASTTAQMDWQPTYSSDWPAPITSGTGGGAAYDVARQRIVLFGGSAGTYAREATWEWDGKAWTLHRPLVRPTDTITAAMVHDPHRKLTILFGAGTVGDETWEWNGTSWTQRNPKNHPPGRQGHAMAFDTARRRVVLWGGAARPNAGVLADTWEWDGTDWKNVTPAGKSPAGRTNHVMTYDSKRRRVVLHAGKNIWEWDGSAWTKVTPSTGNPWAFQSYQVVAYDSRRQCMVMYGGHETWEWDGQKWYQRASTQNGPGAGAVAMVYDSARGRTVLFVEADGTNCNRIWEWNGKQWSRIPVNVTRPPSRANSSMAFDRHRGRSVVFGGHGQNFMNDTWEWDGTVWHNVTPASGNPPGRCGHSMAYDEARKRVVLFGGSATSPLQDTWEWDGTAWRNVTPASGNPPGRYGHSMAYDATRGRVILYGGSGSKIKRFDMWAWDGKRWTPIPIAVPLPGCDPNCMVYDSARRRMVMFTSGPQGAATWEWDGKKWSNVTPATGNPPFRFAPLFAYDPARQRSVLQGGWIWMGTRPPMAVVLTDTWEWDGSAWAQTLPQTRLPASVPAGPVVFDHARGAIFSVGFPLVPTNCEMRHYAPRDLAASAHTVSAATGGQVAFALDTGAAHAGKPYVVLGCFDGPSPRSTQIGNLTIPLVFDNYFRFLAQFPGRLILGQHGRLDPHGRGTATLPVPKLPPAFVGIRLAHAFLAYQTSVDFVSRAVVLEITP